MKKLHFLSFLSTNTRNIAVGALLAVSMSNAQAHTPLFDCFDNGDDTITCEGGFSDGASSEGIVVKVVDAQGKVLEQGKMDSGNSVDFKRPEGEFSVVFEAGDSHSISVYGDDIY